AAEVLLHPVQALDRDEELVPLGVLQLQVLALDLAALRRVVRVDQAHAGEARDAVVDVDDELAGLELQVQRRLAARRAPRGPGRSTRTIGGSKPRGSSPSPDSASATMSVSDSSSRASASWRSGSRLTTTVSAGRRSSSDGVPGSR